MSGTDDIRRSGLEERIRLAEQDLTDLADQVEEGEVGADAAAELEARYRRDLEEARAALSALPRPKKSPTGRPARQDPAPAATREPTGGARSPWPIVAVAAAVMVIATVVIVVLATGGDDAPAEVAPTSDGAAPAATGSLAEMEAAVAAQPDNNAMRLALAGLYFDAGDFMNAMNHYSTVTGSDPTAEQAAIANARIGWMAWTALNDPVTALQFLDAAITLDAAYGEAVLWKGIVLLYGMEDGAAAAPLFEQVLGFPDLPEQLRPDVEQMLQEARGGGQ